jgi:D-alanine-D-alanine ligase
MRQPAHNVLVLYNLPKESAGGSGAFEWSESDAGVLMEVETVVDGLKRLGVRHRIVGVRALHEVPTVLSGGSEHIVFNLVETFQGDATEANLVPAICKAHGKAFTGSDTSCLMLTMDKGRTKAVLRDAGLPCPGGAVVPVGQTIRRSQLPAGPYVVKPAHADASEGIDSGSLVERFGTALNRAVKRVHEGFHQPAIIEQYFGHRELNVSILQRGDRVEVLPVAEIDFSAFGREHPRIVDYSAKWLTDSFGYQNTPRIIPAPLRPRLAERVRRVSLDAWFAVGCSDYARVDLRLDARGRVAILEVNSNPDIGPEGGLDAALDAAKIPYDDFLRIILDNAARRLEKAEPRHPKPLAPPPAKVGCRDVHIRRALRSDRVAILTMLSQTGFFRADELEIAREVLDEALEKGEGGPYQSFVAQDEKGRPAGWVCFGPTPCTLGTYDLYWIVVDPSRQSRGLGKVLMAFAERSVSDRGGRLVVVETSGQSRYAPTRQFYHKLGYKEDSRIHDFYAPGDDKIVYTKRL